MALAFLVVATTAPASAAVAESNGQALVGTFRIAAYTCDGATASGSRFRMVVPSGGPNGPYVSNNDSTCGDKTYTPMAPGTDGGLVTGTYQPEPNPAFDASGNSLAGRITKPAVFDGVAFSTSTNAVDPQTTVHVAAPSVSVANGKLTGDLRAFAASWNRQEFNQGAPKPDGSSPGNTTTPTGTYNAATGAFTLDWASQIQGGPFNSFTGLWHLEGTFTPAQGSTGTTAPPSQPTANRQGSSSPGTASAGAGPGAAPKPSDAAAAPTVATPGQAAPSDASSTPSTPAGSQAEATKSEAATAKASHTSSALGPVTLVAALLLVAAAAGGWYVPRRRGRTVT